MDRQLANSVPTSVLLAHADQLWDLLRRLPDEVSDAEYLWEPVDAWSVRTRADGAVVADWTPDPPIPPFTTIAWRLNHIGQSLAVHAQRLFGQGEFSYATHRPPPTLADAMTFLETSYGWWRKGIASSGDSMSAELATEVLDFTTHHFRHAAEVLTIRDLYRAMQPRSTNAFVDACIRGKKATLAKSDAQGALRDHPDLVVTVARLGNWDVIPLLLDLGFPVDNETGATALHHAAGYGPLSVVSLLVERGADRSRRDPEWNAVPREWASYFGNTDVRDYLSGLE
jgi:hypothetical protein